MSLKDYEGFIRKVDQLNRLIDFLDANPKLKQELIKCSQHDQVVSLAKAWGFEIGKRWGETC